MGRFSSPQSQPPPPIAKRTAEDVLEYPLDVLHIMQVVRYNRHLAGGRTPASWDLLAIWRKLHSTMTSSLLDRSQFPCLRDSVYLNQASLGLIGQPAVAAMHSFLENVARHGNLYMSDSDEIDYGQALRGVAGRLFHNDPSRHRHSCGCERTAGTISFVISSQTQCHSSCSFLRFSRSHSPVDSPVLF